MKPHGPWQILASHEVYRDPWIELQKDDVIRPDGRQGTHCIVRMKPGVSVLPLDDDGTVYLTDEFHYGIGRQAIERDASGALSYRGGTIPAPGPGLEEAMRAIDGPQLFQADVVAEENRYRHDPEKLAGTVMRLYDNRDIFSLETRRAPREASLAATR